MALEDKAVSELNDRVSLEEKVREFKKRVESKRGCIRKR